MWIKTIARFRGTDISDTLWETYSEDQQLDSLEPRDFRFNTDDIMWYNTSTRGGSTIHFRSYDDSITIDMTIDELDRLIFIDKLELQEIHQDDNQAL